MRRGPAARARRSRGAPVAGRALALEADRLRPSAARGSLALVLLAAALVCGAPSLAAAQEGPAGSVTGHVLTSTAPDVGGALGADLWFPIDVFRVGGFLGVAAVPSGEDVQNRVFMPLAASVGLEVLGEVVGVSLRARGGLWGGATQEVKLAAGGFIGGGAYLLFNLGAGASVALGMDVWGIFGDGETALFAPGVGLTWTPAIPET